MRNRRHPILFAALICVSTATSTRAQVFTEDFTTTTYKDEAGTTADWNTTDGELRLFPFAPGLVGSFNTSGSAFGVAVDGDLAFVADGSAGLQIMDISDLASPTVLATVDTPGLAFAVDVAGDHAFVADGVNGLVVIDVSDPANPILSGSYDTPGAATAVDVAGDIAYVADGADGGLQAIDVTNPATPTFVGSFDTPGEARGVVASGDLAYVADRAGGLQILDISDPAGPTFVGTYATISEARGIAIDGGVAFIAGLNDGLLVVDVSSPATPALLGSYVTPGQAFGVSVSGDRAFVADGGGGGLQVIDITDLTSPTLATSFDTSGQGNAVAHAGAHAFVADGSRGLRIIETAGVPAPALAGSYGDFFAPGVAVSGNYALVADQFASAVQVVDISNPFAPTSVYTYPTATFLTDVTVDGDLAFIGTSIAGLEIVDISDLPTSMSSVGSFATVNARNVVVRGDMAFVANGSVGLQILDISDPASPVLLGSYSADEFPSGHDVDVAGNFAYLADNNGLLILDVADPTTPTLVGSYEAGGAGTDPRGVEVAGDVAYVASRFDGLVILDISDPTTPSVVGTYDPGEVRAVSVSGDLAVIIESQSFDDRGIVLDISNPASIASYGEYTAEGSMFHVELNGQFAYFTAASGGLKIVQVLQDEVASSTGSGRSLTVSDEPEAIVRARLTTTQTAGVDWMLSAGGGIYAPTTPDSWLAFDPPDSSLSWSSLHTWAPGLNPTVSELTLEWLVGAGPILSIDDVPDDQGGRVYVSLRRSGYDFADELGTPVTQYGVYRRVDEVPRLAAHPSGFDERVFSGEHVGFVDDVLHIRAGAGSSFPPGTWALINTVPATQSDEYLVEVTTTADSTSSGSHESVYVVSTHTTTPSVWFVSEPDSGYSVDNIAPEAPTALRFDAPGIMAWDVAPENDFGYHTVYGSPNATLESAVVIGHTIETTFDVSTTPHNYYLVTTTDHAGNEGLPSSLIDPSTVDVGQPGMPTAFAMNAPRPNPTRAGTAIGFDVPEAVHVRLAIFDALGRQVRSIVDAARSAGRHQAVWDGRNEAGVRVAAGIYFVKLRAGSFGETRRIAVFR